MTIVLIIGLALLGLSAALGAHALAFGRVRSAERMRSIEMYGFTGDRARVDEDSPRGGLDRLAERLGTRIADRVDLPKARSALLGAGFYRLSAEAYYGYRVLAVAVAIPLALLSVTGSGLLGLLFGGLMVALAWRLPPIIVERRTAQRTTQIDRELPELIDLLIVSIEAGVGLNAAQQLVGDKLEGPLGNELRLMLREQSMGLSNDQALTHLLDRCDTPAVWSFVRSLQQGERLGMSVGQILRNLAVEMRTRRRQDAEERAQKAPIKMLFPLVFLIFPSMFIVLLGPAAFRINEVLGGG